MLITNQKPREGLEIHLSFIESGSEGVEKARGDDEEGQMLEIGVEVEAVACNVVGVVVPLPPADADSGEDIAGENLDCSVEAGVEHDIVMAGVVAYPAALNPEEAY